MSTKQSYFRYRITFSKGGAVRFIGHLDLQSLFQKAIRRAKLPVAYSEGFNPHQLLSFASPLPLGMAGEAEILEVFLLQEMPLVDIVAALNPQLPQGLVVSTAVEVPSIGKSAAALVRIATYSIRFSGGLSLDKMIQAVLESEKIEVKKKGKKGMAMADIRQDIFELKMADAQHLHAVLACGGQRNLKPEILAAHMLELAGIAPEDCVVAIVRLEIGLKD